MTATLRAELDLTERETRDASALIRGHIGSGARGWTPIEATALRVYAATKDRFNPVRVAEIIEHVLDHQHPDNLRERYVLVDRWTRITDGTGVLARAAQPGVWSAIALDMFLPA